MGVIKFYFVDWFNVDLELMIFFVFGGVVVLMVYEIDILIILDFIEVLGIFYVFVFDYEFVFVVLSGYKLVFKDYVVLVDFLDEIFFIYFVLL